MNVLLKHRNSKYLTSVNLKLCSMLLAAIFMQGCATPVPDAVYQNPYGDWSTRIQTRNGSWLPHGTMTFTDKKKATYTFHHGRIIFTEVIDQGLWKGHWIEDSWGTVHCASERDGSKTWGEATMQFDPTYNSFKGTWDKCGDGRTNAWLGQRL